MLRNILMLTILSVSTVIAMSTVAHAETYYDILKNMYKSANEKVEVADFDVIGDPDAKYCLEISFNEPDSEKLVHVRRFTTVRGGRGPALPEKRYTRVAFSQVTESDVRGLFEKVTTTFSSREVLSKHATPYNYELRVRKTTEGFLTFERVWKSESSKKNYNYGYCY